MIQEIINIFKDEIKKVFIDEGSKLVMVVGFFLYGMFYLLPFSTDILTHVPIGVVDQDNTKFSRELIRNIDSSELADVKYKLTDLNEAKDLFYKNKIRAYILIPKDFQKNILNGRYSTITSYEDSAYMIVYKQTASAIFTSSITLASKMEIGGLMKKGVSKSQAMAIKLPFEFVENPLYNPIGSYQNYALPLILILILQQTLLLGSGVLCATDKERIKGLKANENGKIKILKGKYSKFSNNPYAIVIGKSLAYFLIYFIYSLICFFIFPSLAIFKSSYNLSSLVLVVPFILSVAFLAQTLLIFYDHRESPMFILLPTSLPVIFLTGFIWPKCAIPEITNLLAYLIPYIPASDALIKINQMGAKFYQVKGDFIILIALCILYFFSAVVVTKKITKKTR